MDPNKIRALAQQIIAEVDGALTPPAPPAAVIKTSTDLDAALNAAATGAVLTLDPTLVYAAPLRLPKPVTLKSASVPQTRMTADAPAPRFTGGVSVVGDVVSLLGLDVSVVGNRTANAVDVTGAGFRAAACRVRGDVAVGQKRGVAPNGPDWAIVRCWIDRCFGPYPGDDCQAVCAWNTPGPGLLEDNYLAGSTETVMIGGGDPQDEAHTPSDIMIRRNTITKDPAWQSRAISVKNALELKNAKRVTVEDNDIQYAWGGHGQDGYLLMLTVRNQDGRAPWSTLRDVVVRNNRFAHGGAAINILAVDNIVEDKPNRDVPVGTVRRSVPMQNAQIVGNSFADLDPTTFSGSKKMIEIQRGPINLTIDGNDFGAPTGFTSVVYFDGLPQAQNLVVTNNRWPKTTYGVFGTGAAIGQAWAQYVNMGTLSGNVLTS